jgi:hypothetical protein
VGHRRFRFGVNLTLLELWAIINLHKAFCKRRLKKKEQIFKNDERYKKFIIEENCETELL